MNCSILRGSIFVSWVSADGTRTPPSTSRDSHSDKDIFFLPLPLQAPSVMKTKYAHLPLLSVSYPTLSFPSLYSPSLSPFLSFPLCFPDTLANGSCFCARRLSGETANKQSKWRPVAETKEHSAFSEVLQRAVQRGLACIIKWERKPGPLNLPPNGDPSSITGAPLGGPYPKDPLSGSRLSPNCHWQIFFIGRKSCFPGPLALIHSSWLCSFKNSEGTPRVCRMSYLSSSRENRERSEEMHILHRVFLKAYNSLTYF